MRGTFTWIAAVVVVVHCAGCGPGMSLDRPVRFPAGIPVQEGGAGRAHSARGSLTAPLEEVWRRDAPGRAGSIALVGGSSLVLACGVRGGLAFFACADGASEGSIGTRGTLGGAAAGMDTLLYVPFAGLIGAGLLCADLTEGVVRWMREGPSIECAPAIGAAGVTACAYDGTVLHFAHGDSAAIWHRQLPDRITAGACMVDSLVLVPCANGDVYALETRDGSERWRVSTGAPVTGSPACADSVVYVANRAGELRALRLRDGVMQWIARIGTAWHAGVAVGAEVIAAAFPDGSVRVFRRSDGVEQARHDFDRPVVAAPLFIAEPGTPALLVAVSLGGDVALLDAATCTLVWSVTLGARISSPPLFVDGTLVVCTEEGEVVAFRSAGKGTQP
jgi:hypothetical protein